MVAHGDRRDDEPPAISEFVRPRATYSRTSRSRGDSPRGPAVGARPCQAGAPSEASKPGRLDDPYGGEMPSHGGDDDRCGQDRDAGDVEPHARCRPDQVGNGAESTNASAPSRTATTRGRSAPAGRRSRWINGSHTEQEREDQQGPDHGVDDVGQLSGSTPNGLSRRAVPGAEDRPCHRSPDQ